MTDQGEIRDLNLTPTGLRNYTMLLEYLSDPDKDWPKRFQYSNKILGYVKANQIYNTLSPQVITEIETKAFQNREARSARQKAMIRQSLYNRARGYSHDAVKIFARKTKKTLLDGTIEETSEPLIVPYTKHYPPDRGAAQEWMDRTEGKVVERKEITGENGGPVKIKVKHTGEAIVE